MQSLGDPVHRIRLFKAMGGHKFAFREMFEVTCRPRPRIGQHGSTGRCEWSLFTVLLLRRHINVDEWFDTALPQTPAHVVGQ